MTSTLGMECVEFPAAAWRFYAVYYIGIGLVLVGLLEFGGLGEGILIGVGAIALLIGSIGAELRSRYEPVGAQQTDSSAT